MGFFNIYSEAVCVRYKSNTCSKATLFNIFAVCMAILVSYLLAFRTQGFWIRLETFREKPTVHFKHELIAIWEVEETDGKSKTLTWTNIPGLHYMLPEKSQPFIQSSEGPTNPDGTKEFLDIEITIPLLKTQKVYSVHLLLLFDYSFYRHANLQMESMAYVTYTSGKSGNVLDTFADLQLVQKQPLWNRIRDTRFNDPVIPRNSKVASHYSLRSIFGKYTNRNVSTTLTNQYQLWTVDRTLGDEFMFRTRINYVEASYECLATFANTIKWAWVQFLAVFIVVETFVRRFMHAVYAARIFETIREVPKF